MGRPGFWITFVCVIASYPLIHSYTHQLPEPLPALSQVTDFELSNEYGEPYGSKQLKYKMWIVAPMCTACSDQVDVMGERLFRVQHRSRGVKKVFRIVTITRDPERDTPKALETWASKLRYSPRMWTLLTGPKAHVHNILDNIYWI